MKTVEIERLKIVHFKGVTNLEIDFQEKETNIRGGNGTGKTTIVDAFVWCLFGKDSQFKSDFSIKPLDENNHPIENLENEVELCLKVDNQPVCLKRVQREKWVTKRGTSETVFDGNETKCFIDDVPKNVTEFKNYVSSILDEKAFMMVTNVAYFNSINWKERRAILTQMAGEISDSDVIDTLATLQNKDQVSILTDLLNAKKSFEGEKKRLAVERKKAKEEKDKIPARIDEAERAKPEKQDWSAIELEIAEQEQLVKDCDAQLLDKSKGVEKLINQKNELLKEIGELENKKRARVSVIKEEANKGKAELTKEVQNLTNDLSSLEKKITSQKEDINTLVSQIEILEADRKKLIKKWTLKNEEELEFNENDFVCPTCKRAFEDSDIEAKKAEITATFNKQKTESLDEIEKLGATYKPAIERKDEQIGRLKVELSNLESQEAELQSVFVSKNDALTNYQTPDYQAMIDCDSEVDKLTDEIKAKTAQIPEITPQDDSDIQIQKTEANNRLKELRKLLNTKDDIIRQDMRIAELKSQEKTLSQTIAEYERVEFAIENFIKAKIDEVEKRVNSMFNYVKFKMFKEQINGGEQETCEALINGVPFSDANNAAKINAGLDIINALSKHYGIYAPVFIDNRESVNDLIESECQIINLVVTKDKSLKVG